MTAFGSGPSPSCTLQSLRMVTGIIVSGWVPVSFFLVRPEPCHQHGGSSSENLPSRFIGSILRLAGKSMGSRRRGTQSSGCGPREPNSSLRTLCKIFILARAYVSRHYITRPTFSGINQRIQRPHQYAAVSTACACVPFEMAVPRQGVFGLSPA